MIIVVTGQLASGKTHWIRQQIAKNPLDNLYFSPKTESFPLDAIDLQSEFPHLLVLSVGEEDQLTHLSAEKTAYIEIPWYLEDESVETFVNTLNGHQTRLISIEYQTGGWTVMQPQTLFTQTLANSQKTEWLKSHDIQIHRAILTGEVLDFASLETFWAELTQGAYGEVIRVKGIFNIIDGQCIYGEFLKGFIQKDFKPLNLPLSLNGRPNHFSGIEIVGRNLDKSAIGDTLSDCCLPDEAVTYYQQQVKASLQIQEGVA
jgi:hypothetical protein